MRALGDKSELMRQNFVSQVSCKGFGFDGKIRLSPEILAKSFVFDALLSTLLYLWLVSSEQLLNCCLLPPLCIVCPWLPPLCFGAVRYSPGIWTKCFTGIFGWVQLIGRFLVPHLIRMKGGKGEGWYHLTLPVRIFYPFSCMCSHDVCSLWHY